MRIIECGYCGFKGLEEVFKYGKGREYGQHPEHRYCPCCGQSIDWFGFKIIKEVSDTWEDFLRKVSIRRMRAYAGK